jgi:hypothetical protein
VTSEQVRVEPGLSPGLRAVLVLPEPMELFVVRSYIGRGALTAWFGLTSIKVMRYLSDIRIVEEY